MWSSKKDDEPRTISGERVVVPAPPPSGSLEIRLEFAFRWIPPGAVMVGSPGSEAGRSPDESKFEAIFSRGFWMQETPVTQRQYRDLMIVNPSTFKGDDRRPVESVSWEQAQVFAERMNAVVPGGGFRLPREAEWEYAARAGSGGPFGLPSPDYKVSNCEGQVPSLDGFAWYSKNAGETTQAVGQKSANAWGLKDMHGNVWEWCEDRYGDYPTGIASDWTGHKSEGKRVLRGGSWYAFPRHARSACRRSLGPHMCGDDIGFRLVRDAI